jgi:hypothetical protein
MTRFVLSQTARRKEFAAILGTGRSTKVAVVASSIGRWDRAVTNFESMLDQ